MAAFPILTLQHVFLVDGLKTTSNMTNLLGDEEEGGLQTNLYPVPPTFYVHILSSTNEGLHKIVSQSHMIYAWHYHVILAVACLYQNNSLR